MKFDVVRAWKDENYRQTLSEEQLAMLPANPAGELDEAALASVTGAGGNDNGFGDNFGFGVGSSSSSAAAFSRRHTHSLALLCDISIFSLNVVQLNIIPIASPFNQCCGESH